MIQLSRLNGHPIGINAELIKFVEQNPDTVITLVTGDKLVVRESAPEVMRRVLIYRRLLLHPDAPLPDDFNAASAAMSHATEAANYAESASESAAAAAVTQSSLRE